MQQEQWELQHEQLNSNEKTQNKENSNLGGREVVEGTPYYKVWTEQKWFITFAEYRITEEYPLIEDEPKEQWDERVRRILEKDLHWIIMRVAGCMHEKIAQAAILASHQEKIKEKHEREDIKDS